MPQNKYKYENKKGTVYFSYKDSGAVQPRVSLQHFVTWAETE